MSTGNGKSRHIAYLTLQATREGQAAHAHVHEIIAGLRELGWGVDLHEPTYRASNPGVIARLTEFRRIQKRLIKHLGDYDAVYVRAHPFALETSRAAARAGIPVIQESNGPYKDLFTAWPGARSQRRVIERWQREQYRSAAALIAISDSLAEWLRSEAPGADVTTIPNGANTDLFTSDAVPLEGLPARYVVFFGALASWQGVNTMLSAEQHTDWPADVALVIAGDGVERNLVERAALERPRVVYLGTIPYREVPRLVTGSIAGLSTQSGAPGRPLPSAIKVFETLACGAPTVVTVPSGAADFVRLHRCGLVVPPDDPAALAGAVAQLAADPATATAMGARGREAVVAEASWQARAAATSRVIERATNRRPS